MSGALDSAKAVGVGYCVIVDALLEGAMPSVRNASGYPYVFETREAAQREIAECAIERLKEFLGGEREFEDAMTVEEYVIEVGLWPDGSVSTEDGGYYSLHPANEEAKCSM